MTCPQTMGCWFLQEAVADEDRRDDDDDDDEAHRTLMRMTVMMI